MRNSVVAVLFAVLALGVVVQADDQSTFSIDQAADLLEDLQQDSIKSYNELQDNWTVKKPILEQNVASLADSLAAKGDECANLDDVLADSQKRLLDAQNFGKWLEERITQNINQISSLLEKRCSQNNNYVEGLKNDKIALKLVAFLRAQIQGKESFDLAQRKAFMHKLNSFLQVYKRGDYTELVQLEKQYVDASQYDVETDTEVQGRSSDEIGSGHIDNSQGDLALDNFQNGDRKGWSQIQKELIDLLDSLEATIKAKIAQAQEDEVASNIAAAEYKLKLEQEIQIYQRDLIQVQQKIVKLEAEVAADQANVEQCRSEEAALFSQHAGAVQDLQDQTDVFNKKQADFEEEIAIFKEVIDAYGSQVDSQDDSFKGRADDYIDNGVFDNNSYDDREVPDIQLLNN